MLNFGCLFGICFLSDSQMCSFLRTLLALLIRFVFPSKIKNYAYDITIAEKHTNPAKSNVVSSI